MVDKRHILIFIMIILAATLACNFPLVNPPAPTPNAAESTAIQKTIDFFISQTVAVNLTETATALTTPSTPTSTPPPTLTFTPQPPSVPPQPPPPPIPCDRALFVTDVTIPDGTRIPPNQDFVKTWRLQNFGSCTWTTSYTVVFESGAAMDGPASTNLPNNVAPGQTIDISINLTSPSAPGVYRGNWKLRNAAGYVFGTGVDASTPFWVSIVVPSTTITPTPTITRTPTATVTVPVIRYNFLNNMCSAAWTSGAGSLPCPGTNTDANGFVLKLDNPRLENGAYAGQPALETHPQWVDNGFIQGIYPAFTIQNGDRFVTRLSCLYNSGGSACNVRYFIKYSADGGPWTDLGPSDGWNKVYDSTTINIDISLSSLTGKSVSFLLLVNANGAPTQDWALWVNPQILH